MKMIFLSTKTIESMLILPRKTTFQRKKSPSERMKETFLTNRKKLETHVEVQNKRMLSMKIKDCQEAFLDLKNQKEN